MKLLPFLLYLVALGLFGLAGWTVYQMLPLWKTEVRTEATTRGQVAAQELLLKGRSQGQRTTAWVYSDGTQSWWAKFKQINLIGKPPPPPPTEGPPPPPPAPPPVEVRPLEQIFELVGLVHDGQAGGKGGNSHVIVRFKPEANVEPPEWWVRLNTPTAAGGARRLDVVANPPPSRGAQPPRPPQNPRPGTPMPGSTTGQEIVQHLWVDDGGDPRRSATLWAVKAADGRPMGAIRLVGVAPDAQAATFAREVPGAAPGDPPQIREELLIKSNLNLSQDVLRATRELQGRAMPAAGATGSPSAGSAPPPWIEVAETTRNNDVWNIGTNDERTFAENPDRFVDQLNFDTYVSRDRSTRGLILKGVPAQISSRFGLSAGDVLIEINGQPVKSRSDAFATAKKDYERGVRTFHSKWMVNGQIVDRTYQVPNRK